MGTWGEIRTRIHCLFCRFLRDLAGSYRSHDDDSALCTALVDRGLEGFSLYVAGDYLTGNSGRIIPVGRSAQAGAHCGRLVDPSGLDYSMIKNWLTLCEHLHQDACPISSRLREQRALRLPRLRVVDVLKDCLVDIPLQQKYVALSYVWGSAQLPKLVKAELPSLIKHGALKDIRLNAPRTIQDAMEFTSRMGVQYLWFDSLCLVQDDPGDLDRGIKNMDIVYESAYFTVIAACGDTADSGLAGMGQTPRNCTQVLGSIKPGLDLLWVVPLDDHLNRAVWGSRGWTWVFFVGK